MTTRPGTKREQVKLSRDSSKPGMSRWKIVTSTDEWALREKKREREAEGGRCEVKSYKETHSYTSVEFHSSWTCVSCRKFYKSSFTKMYVHTLRVFMINVCLIDLFKPYDARSADFHEYRISLPLHPSGAVKCLSPGISHIPTDTG